jgi:glycosyltransferase involved in cell wall biosynthesis
VVARLPRRLIGVRIVHVSDCYAPRVGGIETQVQDLATHQARRGDAVHVLTATALAKGTQVQGRSRYRASTTDAPGLRVHRLASRSTFGLPVHPRGLWLIRRALTMLKPDVVHVHAGVVSPFAYDGARAARDLGLPLAITWHCMLDGVESLVAAGSRMTGWDDALFAPSAVSTVAAERVADALDRSDVSVLPNGLDLDPWRAAAAHAVPNERPGTLRVVATQRLAPRKRAIPMIRAVQRAHRALGELPDGSPRIRLTLVGGGPAEPQVRSEVMAEGLEHVVQVMGTVPRAVLPTLYRDQDVFVSPAVLEAFGIAPLEARVAGLAVVGRAGTGLSEFVEDGVNGFLVSSDTATTDALVRLASEPALLAGIRATNSGTVPAVAWGDVLDDADRLYARARSAVGAR